ncbi:MAG: BlaI/MecI/CopY family transcriptional regulator [Planctomycetia bacterium]
MVRQPTDGLTPREAQIMDVLWNLGRAGADQVRAALPDPLHDSTVRTMLRILVEKGFVKRGDTDDGALYRPAVKRAQMQRRAVAQMLDRFFGGSAQDLVLRLLEDKRLSSEQLRDLSRRPDDDAATEDGP